MILNVVKNADVMYFTRQLEKVHLLLWRKLRSYQQSQRFLQNDILCNDNRRAVASKQICLKPHQIACARQSFV
jgi:hypothetical protein